MWWLTEVSSTSRPSGSTSKPIFSWRLGITVVRFVLPVRSPRPFMHPWTWRTPDRTAAMALATAHPVSSWQWMARVTSSRKWAFTVATMASTSWGSEPPLVSHSTRWLAPLTTAASRARRANSGLCLYPSKKCSASTITRRPWPRRYSTESAIIASPSSSVVLSALRTW